MQQPQMPAGPQPAGIPGGTIVAQNQMQQSPWMGSQMQQGIGGQRPMMGQRPMEQGQPRMRAAQGRFIEDDPDFGKTREEIIAEGGLDSGPSLLDFVKPRAEIIQSGATPDERTDVDTKDITYGGSGLYQGDKWYGGGDYQAGNVKVNVQEDGNTVYQDTMSKDDLYNLYAGIGEKEGNRVEIGKNSQGTWTLNIVKSFNQGGRIGFGLGGFNKARRAFLKMMAGITAGGVAAGTGLLKFGKAAKVVPKVTETIVQSNAAGMPAWFPSLVRRVIKEGEDISKGAATVERQTVHTIKLPESGTPVEVTRNLVTDDIIVDIGEQTKHGWSSGRHGQPTRLVLKKGEWIEPTKGKKGIKTKDEFSVEEAEFTGGHPENVKFEEVAVEKYGDHASDFTEIEKYAVGKNTDKKIIGKKAQSDAWAEGRAESQAEDIDYASGGLARMLGE